MSAFDEIDVLLTSGLVSVEDLETLENTEAFAYAKGWNHALRTLRTTITSLKYKHEGYPE